MILETVAVAFAMFSALPVPQPAWNQQNTRYALCAFPLIGFVIGEAWWGWEAVCRALQLPRLLRAAGLCLAPVVITGGIHLDGYADTVDALASHAPPERKREILKDPHCGAFAVIYMCVYFVRYLALCGAVLLDGRALAGMGVAFALIRALSGFAIVTFPLAKKTGLAYTFSGGTHRVRAKWILGAEIGLLAAGLCLLLGLTGVCMAAAAGVCLWRYVRCAQREFGGISGDLAGWFLQKTEWCLLAVLVLWQYGEMAL